MSPQFDACEILSSIGTPARNKILAGMPGTALDYAIHGAAAVMDVERYQFDTVDSVKAGRCKRLAKVNLKAAADLGHASAAALYERVKEW